MNRKSVLTIVHVIDTLGLGGAEKLLLDSLPLFSMHRNIVIALNGNQNNLTKQLPNVEYHFANMGRFKRLLKGIRFVQKIVATHNADIVHSHLYTSNIVCRLAKKSGVPVVNTIHTNIQYAKNYQKWYLSLLEKVSFWYCKPTIIGVAHHVLDSYLKYYGYSAIKTHMVDNFIDLNSIHIKTDRRNLREKSEVRLIAIGSLRYPKNQEFLVEAFKSLDDSRVTLDIYGNGPNYKLLAEEISKSGVNIRLMGENELAPGLLSKYDLFVMPSLVEGSSLSVLEAMASEVPLLISDIPAFRQQCEGQAYYFNLDSKEDFIIKLKHIIEHFEEVEEKVKKAASIVNRRFVGEKYRKQILEIYNWCLQK